MLECFCKPRLSFTGETREFGHEAESAAALAEALLQDIDMPAERIDAIVSNIRNELAPPCRSLTTES